VERKICHLGESRCKIKILSIHNLFCWNFAAACHRVLVNLRGGQHWWAFAFVLCEVQLYFASSQNRKSELMLMKRARAYSRSCSQVILVYLHPFRRNSLFCSRKSQKSKNTKNPHFRVKIVNVDIIKKHAIGACYGNQHVCAYLQPFLR